MTCWWDFLLFLHFRKSVADPRLGAKRGDRASEGEGWGLGSTPRRLGLFGDHGTVAGGSRKATGQCLPSLLLTKRPQETRRPGGSRGRDRSASGSSLLPPPPPGAALTPHPTLSPAPISSPRGLLDHPV